MSLNLKVLEAVNLEKLKPEIEPLTKTLDKDSVLHGLLIKLANLDSDNSSLIFFAHTTDANLLAHDLKGLVRTLENVKSKIFAGEKFSDKFNLFETIEKEFSKLANHLSEIETQIK